MPDPMSCSEEDVMTLVHSFYARVREDGLLGPIFNAHVDDWGQHLTHLCDFWSALLRGTSRFTGSPMQKHAALPNLSEALFERWLALFQQTAHEHPNQVMAREAGVTAQRIAGRLWAGYQYSRGMAGDVHA